MLRVENGTIEFGEASRKTLISEVCMLLHHMKKEGILTDDIIDYVCKLSKMNDKEVHEEAIHVRAENKQKMLYDLISEIDNLQSFLQEMRKRKDESDD